MVWCLNQMCLHSKFICIYTYILICIYLYILLPCIFPDIESICLCAYVIEAYTQRSNHIVHIYQILDIQGAIWLYIYNMSGASVTKLRIFIQWSTKGLVLIAGVCLWEHEAVWETIRHKIKRHLFPRQHQSRVEVWGELRILQWLSIYWQLEGMWEVGSARYEPALLPPCSTIRDLSCRNCRRSTHSISKWIYRNAAL